MDDLTFSQLRGLHSRSHLHLLDAVDDLRAHGVSDFLSLPQLIVCGDQSSGKSSVLEAISGVPFPKKDNLCTRFATEVILRRRDSSDQTSAKISIRPGASRSENDRENLLNFQYDLASMAELPDMIRRAKDAMGLGNFGNAFSTDVLRLEVSGPSIPQLTIVDLPGLIHSANKLQTAQDVELVTALVEEYMQQERSIILAIVSAKNDSANQIVLKMARAVDPEGLRTLGIITKPDTLHPGSESETAFIELARNQDVKFKLGWHVVCNPDSNNIAGSGKHRDAEEQAFFLRSKWNKIDENILGIASLRDRLSRVLFEQMRKELPRLIEDIEKGISTSVTKLQKLGRGRSTEKEYRMYLSEAGQSYSSLCRSGCDGYYEASFFRESDPETRIARRMRALVQNDSQAFAQMMLTAGSNHPMDFESFGIARKKALASAKLLLRVGRGRELPGTFNPLIIGELFQDHSSRWESLAQTHVKDVWQQARQYVNLVLKHVTEEDVGELCYTLLINSKLDELLASALKRLGDVMNELRQHPITYNHYFTDTVRKIRNKRLESQLMAKFSQVVKQGEYGFNAESMTVAAMSIVDPDMEAAAAEDVVDNVYAYYKVSLKRLIDNIPAQVIEPTIINKLPQLFTSQTAWLMDARLAAEIAGETEAKQQLRHQYSTKLAVLQAGEATCKRYNHHFATESSNDEYVPMSEISSENTPSDFTPEGGSDGIDGDAVQIIQECDSAEPHPEDIFQPVEEAPSEAALEICPEPESAQPSQDVRGFPSTSSKIEKKKKSAMRNFEPKEVPEDY